MLCSNWRRRSILLFVRAKPRYSPLRALGVVSSTNRSLKICRLKIFYGFHIAYPTAVVLGW